MKKYISRATRWLMLFTIISGVVLIAGVISIIANSSNVGLQVGLTISSGLMSVVFLSCFFAERSRYITIDDEQIVLPRGADKNGKMIFKRIIVKLNEIVSVESKVYKGDKIMSGDCFFHTLKLKDGTKITFTLYAYGKEAEKEIIEIIKNNI